MSVPARCWIRLIFSGLLLIGFASAEYDSAIAAGNLPIVGCPSDGQQGPLAAPTTISLAPDVPRTAAEHLAYYVTGDGLGALAPRGWHCFGLYGSDGEQLIVTPERHDASDLLGSPPIGLVGSAVQLVHMYGGTSGRFAVARVVARLFPANAAFVRQVVNEGIEPASDFPIGAYAMDHLKRKGATTVEFWTPGNTDGMGTASRLTKNADPIQGVAILLPNDDMDLIQVFVRLPSDSSDLPQNIVAAVEHAFRHAG